MSWATVFTFVAGLIVVYMQYHQNELTRLQLESQQKQIAEASDQYRLSRNTELMRILYDETASESLRTTAVRELLAEWQGGFIWNGHEIETFDNNFKQKMADEVVLDGDEHRDLVLSRCIRFYESGGGSGSTVRQILSLRRAYLAGVDLSDIRIDCVDFSHADLTDTIWSGASLANVLMVDVKLTGARGRPSAWYIYLAPATTIAPITDETFPKWDLNFAVVPCGPKIYGLNVLRYGRNCS